MFAPLIYSVGLEWVLFNDYPEFDMPFVPWSLKWSFFGPDTSGIVIPQRDQAEWEVLAQYEKYKKLFA